MKDNTIKFIKFIVFSASNDARGASSKKLIGYVFAFCILICHLSWLKNSHTHDDYSLLMQVLWFDGLMISSIYGLNITDKKLNDPKAEVKTQTDKEGNIETQTEAKV